MPKILFTGGLGDILAVESRMTDAEKFAVKEIYLATPGARFICMALAYHYLWYKVPIIDIISREQITQYAPSRYCIHTLNELNNVCISARIPQPPQGIQDFSIMRIFAEIRSGQRPWTGSGFAFPRVKCDLVCDFATTSGDYRINDRNFSLPEIDAVKEYAKNNNLSIKEIGEGKTTFEEFVSFTLGCREFIGVDSAASVLAAIDKVRFPDKKIFVRSNNKAWYNHRGEWYPPAAMDFFYGSKYPV